MKILNVTTVGSTQGFFTKLFENLLSEGTQIELAGNELEWNYPDKINELGIPFHHIDWSRSPKSSGNLKAIKEIRELVKAGNYDIVHCHTPIASAITRFALRKFRKNGLRVIYTAHGFHFYKGAPLKNWLVFYPVEWICSHWTDNIITINREDFQLSKERFTKAETIYVPGVGIDTEKFRNACSNWTKEDFAAKRKSIGVPVDALLLLSVGELNENKNHSTVIQALAEIYKKYEVQHEPAPSIHYVIAGQGNLKETNEKLADCLGIGDKVHFLGSRSDVPELYKIADIMMHPSFREGLSVALMEGMAAGLPCIVSDIRGNQDLIKNGKGGILCNPHSAEDYAEAIETLTESKIRDRMGKFNAEIVEDFCLDSVVKIIKNIYFCNV